MKNNPVNSILFNLSLFFAVIGIFIWLFILFYVVPSIVKVNAPKCPNIEDARSCWSYLGIILPFSIPFLISFIFYLFGKYRKLNSNINI